MLEFNDISYSEVAIIKELWEKNRKYNENISEFFGDAYKGIDFESRIKGCKVIGATVSQENKPTIGFYKKLGFYPNTLYMQQK